MKCCNLVKAKRMRTMKLSVCCYVTRKDNRANFCFRCYHLNFIKKTLGSQNYAYVFLKNEMNVFLLIYCCFVETKTLLIISFFLLFFSNMKTTKIHAACHTLDIFGYLWTFLTAVYQEREKKILAKNKRICAYVGL